MSAGEVLLETANQAVCTQGARMQQADLFANGLRQSLTVILDQPSPDFADAGKARSFYVTLSSCSRPGFSRKTRISGPARVLSRVILTEVRAGHEKGVAGRKRTMRAAAWDRMMRAACSGCAP